MIKEGIKKWRGGGACSPRTGQKQGTIAATQSINIFSKKHHPTYPLLEILIADEMCERVTQLPSFRDADDRPSQTVICKKWFAYVWVCAHLR